MDISVAESLRYISTCFLNTNKKKKKKRNGDLRLNKYAIKTWIYYDEPVPFNTRS